MSENSLKNCQKASQTNPVTENRVKELIVETLIELELLPQTPRKRSISDV
jgi:hypothetical protein